MRANARINGNIIVNSKGGYSNGDLGAHEDRFDVIKQHYAIGKVDTSRLLTEAEIKAKAGSLLQTLNILFDTEAPNTSVLIGQKGRVMNKIQIELLLDWLNN